METCPFTAIDELDETARQYIRHGRPTWGSGDALQLDRDMFYPMTPDVLRVGGRQLRRIPTPPLAWIGGLARHARIHCDRWTTHFHTDLIHGETRVHIDYFHFIGWGPLQGVEGFAISREGSVLVAGGHWGQPPAGGYRNWPVAVDLGSFVLNAYEPCRREGENFHCEGVALWEKRDSPVKS
ncbi:MAG TPA: hypothetical protein PLU30_22505 [Verrucomicrobiae bacterium]|nr:hypothetical protein [Verrucomicrobiae bacterium]